MSRAFLLTHSILKHAQSIRLCVYSPKMTVNIWCSNLMPLNARFVIGVISKHSRIHSNIRIHFALTPNNLITLKRNVINEMGTFAEYKKNKRTEACNHTSEEECQESDLGNSKCICMSMASGCPLVQKASTYAWR